MEPRSVGQKPAAIFVADVESHSRLIGRDEVGTLRTLTAYRVTVDRLIVSHRGRLFKTTGDGYQVPQHGGCVEVPGGDDSGSGQLRISKVEEWSKG